MQPTQCPSCKTSILGYIWTQYEEALLIIHEDAVAKGGGCDNGTFKTSVVKNEEKTLNSLYPNFDLRTNPRIENKMWMLKKHYDIAYDMLSKMGFAWNDAKKKKKVELDNEEAWLSYVKE